MTCRSWCIGIVLVAALGISLSAQWPAFPAERPRTADGKPDLLARAPHVTESRICPASGRTGLEGDRRRQRRQRHRRRRNTGRSPTRTRAFLRHRIRCARRAAVSAVGCRAQEAAHGRQHEGQPRRLPADGQHAAAHASAARKIVQTSDVIVILYEGNAGIRQLYRRPATARTTLSPGGSATPPANGKATRW